jgi:uncharacterized iron-regulated protein
MSLALLISVCCISGFTGNALYLGSVPPGTVLSGDSTCTVDEMLSSLDEAEIVFVGEKHDDPLAHAWELYIWSRLAGPERALALEMFETDVQELLDGYLAGEVSVSEFLDGSRPWGNYVPDYFMMVELARLKGYDVIAANVPRHYASDVAREGWETLADQEFFRELTVDSSSTLYHDLFLETMGLVGDQMHEMPMDPMNMYRAQLLKDAVMASSVDGIRCVFVCGSFHSDYHSGIPDQLPPDVSFVTVKILAEGEEYAPEMADFVIAR